METANKTVITVQTTVKAPVAKVWESWTSPEHITKWCQASDDWHVPHADFQAALRQWRAQAPQYLRGPRAEAARRNKN